jgi:hypothetical protein
MFLSSHYNTNPHGELNLQLLNRYHAASGNMEAMQNLIKERNIGSTIQEFYYNQLYREEIIESPKGNICFAVLVHRDRDLVIQLINNIKYYCPNSLIVLYNGGDDPHLCDNLGVPVCPSSKKLDRGFTTIYFIETMEWLEEMGLNYEYFINIDSDALFFRHGYEEFVQREMQDTDYMAVSLRIPEDDWYIGIEMRKDLERWNQLFNTDPLYGIFNVGQVISKPLIKALLEPDRKEKIKKALIETISFGTDETVFVNMAKELKFRVKCYPYDTDSLLIRYRPYFTLSEMIDCYNNIQQGWLCHPIYLNKDDLVRKLIKHLETDQYINEYKKDIYPWHDISMNYTPSIPIISSFGNLEIVINNNTNTITHYWNNPESNSWVKSEDFAFNATGIPLFHNNASEYFEVVSKLNSGVIAFWYRDNFTIGHPWHGPFIITEEDVIPIMLAELEDGRSILVCKSQNSLVYWVKTNNQWVKNCPI